MPNMKNWSHTKLYNLMVKLMKFYGNNDKYNIEKKDELNKVIKNLVKRNIFNYGYLYTINVF